MQFYDDKTEGVSRSDDCLIINNIDEDDSVTFKASYIVTGDLICNGKITALFDLYVIGNIEADDIDVKGKFICLGSCEVENAIVVQNDIWANDLSANSVVCHDRVVAQGLDVRDINADGSIIVGKTLAIENEARSMQNVICGETAFGAGKLIANKILTAEPLDLDDGEEALENPFIFHPENGSSAIVAEMTKFAMKDDYDGYFSVLFQNSNEEVQKKLKRHKTVFDTMYDSYPNNIGGYRDVTLLLLLFEIADSDYFALWPKVTEWIEAVQTHFDNLIHGKTETEKEISPATMLKEGYIVSHVKFGRGIVTNIKGDDNHKYVIVNFDSGGEKIFSLPDCIKFFKLISEKPSEELEEIKGFVTCNIENYEEWLNALVILNSNKAIIGDDLFEVIYDKLLSQIGLKAKFVQDRLREKGW